MRTRAPDRTREIPLLRRLTATAVVLSLIVLPAPPAVAHSVPAEPTQAAYLLPPEPTAARVAAERTARSFTRRMTPAVPVAQPKPVLQAVAQKPAVKSAKPAVKPVKPVVKKPAPKKAAVVKAPVEKVTVSGRGAVIAQFGLSQVGERYVWGSSGPNQWDCSGLSQGAARAAGVNLPHQSGAQMNYGRAVSRSQLQPGDLVFWSGHVAISLGGNRIVHAANSKVGVVVGTIYGSPIGYRRIV